MSILENVLMSKMKDMESRPKKGPFCDSYCRLSENNCPACLARQEHILARLSELEALEKNMELMKLNPEMVKAKRFTKCTFCAAPYAKGDKVCPYCDTPYPADALTMDIPVSEAEQDKLLLDTATSVYAEYTDWMSDWRKILNQGKKAVFANGFNKLGKLLLGYDMDTLQVMNSQQIRACANKYGVSYREYIYGVMTRTYKSMGELDLEEKNAKMQKEQEQMKRLNEQNMARLQAQQQNRSSYTMMDYMQRRAENSSYGYSGGTTRCCGNCQYYGAGKCCATGGKYEGWSRNASDSTCGWYKMM